MLKGPSRSPTSSNINSIVVFLHGYGSCGENMIDIANIWADSLPQTLFVAPNAPQPCDISPIGYQWFGLPDFNPFNIRQGLEYASPILLNYLTELLKEYQLSPENMALVGFSQGCILSLDALFSPLKFGAVVGYSGAFFAPDFATDNKKNERHLHSSTPVLLVHGTDDMVVPYAAMVQAEGGLKSFGFNVETLTCKGIEHTISSQGLAEGLNFIKNNIRLSSPPSNPAYTTT